MNFREKKEYLEQYQNLKRKINRINLQIDEKICTMYEYFDIFLGRMLMSRSAAEVLGTTFKIKVNGIKIL